MSGDYFDALESELREAVPRAARNRGGLGRRRWLPSRTVVAATLSVATTVAVAAVAIVLLGHHRASAPRASVPQERRRQPGVQVSGGSLGSIPTLAQLRDNFAVLRRPQTAADRTFTCRLKLGKGISVDARISVWASLRVGGGVLLRQSRPAARVQEMKMTDGSGVAGVVGLWRVRWHELSGQLLCAPELAAA